MRSDKNRWSQFAWDLMIMKTPVYYTLIMWNHALMHRILNIYFCRQVKWRLIVNWNVIKRPIKRLQLILLRIPTEKTRQQIYHHKSSSKLDTHIRRFLLGPLTRVLSGPLGCVRLGEMNWSLPPSDSPGAGLPLRLGVWNCTRRWVLQNHASRFLFPHRHIQYHEVDDNLKVSNENSGMISPVG